MSKRDNSPPHRCKAIAKKSNQAFRRWGEVPYISFPSSILSKINRKMIDKHQKSPIFDVSGYYPNLLWDSFKRGLIEKIERSKVMFFPIISNFKGVLRIVVVPNNNSTKVNLLTKTSGNYYFLNELFDRRQKNVDILSFKFYKYIAKINDMLCMIYSREPMKINSLYWFEGLEVPLCASEKAVIGEINAIDCVYILSHFKEFKEDYSYLKWKCSVKSVSDLSITLDENLDPCFSDIENYILAINTFFAQNACSALNLIFVGEGSTKKSTYCSILAKIFGETLSLTELGTEKSLIPSFYGDDPKLGVIMSSRFVALLDEMMRFFSQRSKDTGLRSSIFHGLEQIMNIVDRIEREISSPKGNVKVLFENSFLATDNFNQDFHEHLKEIYRRDKALCRRFNFLILSPESTARLQSLLEKDFNRVFLDVQKKLELIVDNPNSKPFCSGITVYKDLMKFLRSRINDVEITKEMIDGLINSLNVKSPGIYSSAKAVLIGVTLIHSVFNRGLFLKKKFVPARYDLEVAFKVLERLNNDTCYVYGVEE